MGLLLGILAWSASCLAAPAASRPLELLAVPAGARAPIAAEARAIRKSPLVESVSGVFAPSEAAALTRLGDRALGATLRLRFRSKEKEKAFRAWAAARLTAFRLEANPVARAAAADEPLLPYQWGVRNTGGTYAVDRDDFTTLSFPARAGEDIGALGAPAAAKPVVVAVLDSGVDLAHPDLAGALERHEAECAAALEYQACVSKQGTAKCDPQFLTDHDGNGYPLDCNGWNLAEENDGASGRSGALPKTDGILGNNHVADYVGHGTHVAGIIGARTNGVGIAGVAPNARILPVRVISGQPNEVIRAQDTAPGLPNLREDHLNVGYGLGDIVARGLLYSILSGAQVINLSLGWPDPLDSQLLRRLIALARARGILLVAAAGNDSTDSVILPCRYDGVICVGAHAPDGALAFFSNYGYGVDVLAPGWNIVSTYPTGLLPISFTDHAGYEAKDGTSMAAPFVSGLLARLLGTGMSPDEAYSRLILGARPTQPSQIEDPQLFENASLAGNADLRRSLGVSPQPLVLPSRKDAVRVEWDGVASSVPLRFYLADHWLDARDVTVSVRALEPDGLADLAQTRFSVPSWKAREEKSFDTELLIRDRRVNSELDLEVSVSGPGLAARVFRLRAELVVPVGKATRSWLRQLPITGADGRPLSRAYDDVFTVRLPADEGREYLGITTADKVRHLDLLVEKGGAMTLAGSLSLPDDGRDLTSLEKLTDPRTGASFYALLEVLPAASPQRGRGSQFTYLDASLRPLPGRGPESVDPTITFLPDSYSWQAWKGELAPSWYGVGLLPPLERKPYDPWNPGLNTKPGFRFYVLARDGLHTVALPDAYPQMVSLLPASPAQRKAGVVPVMLATGQDYALESAEAELSEGAWTPPRPVKLPVYHNLQGIVPASVLSLDPSSSFAGSVFSGFVQADSAVGGIRRSSVLLATGVADVTAKPLRKLDVVTDVPGTYAGPKRLAQFTLTKYAVQLHDFSSGRTAMTDQKRFSFLPSLFSQKAVFPLLVRDAALAAATGEERAPAVFVPGDFLYSKATQVIAPRFDAAGGLRALRRPALFHLESRDGCTALPTARAAGRNGPSELVFFCGDHFTSAALAY